MMSDKANPTGVLSGQTVPVLYGEVGVLRWECLLLAGWGVGGHYQDGTKGGRQTQSCLGSPKS